MSAPQPKGSTRRVSSFRHLVEENTASAGAARKQSKTARGEGVAAHPLPDDRELVRLAAPVPASTFLDCDPRAIAELRDNYKAYTEDAASVSMHGIPQLVLDTVQRLRDRSFGGKHPDETQLPLRPSEGAILSVLLRIGVERLAEDEGLRLAEQVIVTLGRSNEGNKATRALLMAVSRLDLGGATTPGKAIRKNAWIDSRTRTLVGELAKSLGLTFSTVAAIALMVGCAAEPTAKEDERREMAEAAAAFVSSTRLKGMALALLMRSLLGGSHD